MGIRCWSELVSYGALEFLSREYGSRLRATPEADYDVSLDIDLEQVPPAGGQSRLTPFAPDLNAR